MADRPQRMNQVSRLVAAATLALTMIATPLAHAVQPGERLSDPGLEQRARAISAELRCMVCQNQSIDESNAELARDLRVLVRDRISAGDTDREVLDYVVSRYGDFVLLRPPFRMSTLLLWFAPLLVLLAAISYAFMAWRRQSAALSTPRAAPALSDDERAELDKILKN